MKKKSPTLRPTLIKIAFSDNSPRARAALKILYETYCEPVRGYIRRWRYAGAFEPDQVDELMQDFFTLRIAKLDLVKNWDPERTRFRSWLFASVNNFLLNKLDQQARERFDVSYQDVLHAPSDVRTPQHLLEVEWARDWANVLITQAFAALRAEYARKDLVALHDALSPYLGLAVSRAEEPPYADLSARLGRPQVTLRGDMSKMRRYWKGVIWELIRQTVPDGQVRGELELLISVLENQNCDSAPLPPARRRSPRPREDEDPDPSRPYLNGAQPSNSVRSEWIP